MRLKIELKLKGTTISGRVLEQNEFLRRCGKIRNNNYFTIRADGSPALRRDTLFVRGRIRESDNQYFRHTYSNTMDANNAYKSIISLVNELNDELGGVVDELGNVLFTKGDTIGIIHNQGDWESLETGVDKDQSAKADKGKLELSLVNPELVKAVAEVRMYGTKKYGDSENWRKVEPKRYVDALYRHLLAYIEGNEVDEESGLSHLSHMACNISFLLDEEYLKEHESEV